ncbi:hypothetical protein ACF06I_18925 [Streptomyces albidoflavus]|uniref:hypothetical protein n=1 Tax=Streptomyces albidoflavus TaxID=1886 RepID=UPI0034108873
MNPGDEQGYDTDERYGGTGQTRTRLPGDEDTYDTARRSMRPSRSLITVVGVVVLLIAAIAFANQNTDTPDNPSDARGPAASPTSPTGTKPVDTSTSGIPTGHPQTKQGAESAAANYTVVMGSPEMFEAERRGTIVDALYDIDAERAKQLDKAYSSPELLSRIGLTTEGKAPDGQTFVSRFVPVGTKVEKFDSDQATVAVWYSSLFGLAGENSRNPVTESWYTTTYQLKWQGDWKIADWEQVDGPVPVRGDQKASSADDMAESVTSFGGFTYAR